GYDQVLPKASMPGAQWFSGAALNYAQQCLHWAENADFAQQTALIAQSETERERQWTWEALSSEVAHLQQLLREHGVER
ncbi:MAG TPA: acetoacetate--CoA ligase, partial [Lautropia sp.]|nr:acetoacetate--CoA ligase [Lautropia sp.]